MSHRLRVMAASVLTTGLVVGYPATSLASEAGAGGLGPMVAMCAHDHLGKRSDAPTATCVCNGTTMVFANFGAMVRHMKQTSCAGCC